MPLLVLYLSPRGLHDLRKRVFELSKTLRQTDTQAGGHGESITELTLSGKFSKKPKYRDH